METLIHKVVSSVNLSNNHAIKAYFQGLLPQLQALSAITKTISVLPHLKSVSLISLGQLCGKDFEVLLDKGKMHVVKSNKLVLQGDTNMTSGIWNI